jgi:ABC-type multidrug transport system ATPase subunit
VTAAIAVRNLEKRYGPIEAVRGISFEVAPGETFGFLGPNGAGKSTTINILCTLAAPTGGGATVAGHDVVTGRGEVRRNIGLVFQDPTLDLYLTAEQNLKFHAELYGIPRAVLDDRIAIMNQGEIVVLDTPEALKASVGKDRVQIQTDDDTAAIAVLRDRFGIEAAVLNGAVTFSVPAGEQFVPRLFAELGLPIRSVSVARPSLDDVFLAYTGTTIADAESVTAVERMRGGAFMPRGR